MLILARRVSVHLRAFACVCVGECVCVIAQLSVSHLAGQWWVSCGERLSCFPCHTGQSCLNLPDKRPWRVWDLLIRWGKPPECHAFLSLPSKSDFKCVVVVSGFTPIQKVELNREGILVIASVLAQITRRPRLNKRNPQPTGNHLVACTFKMICWFLSFGNSNCLEFVLIKSRTIKKQEKKKNEKACVLLSSLQTSF